MNQPILSRRQLLSSAGGGIGMLALSSLLRDQGLLASTGSNARPPHQKPAAKAVIWLFMNGGPSGIDLFDHKPALKKWDGKSFPGQIETLFPYPGPIMDSPFRFRRYGECGATVSDVFPYLAQHVDKITFLPACTTEGQNHVPACYMMNTGRTRFGAPSIGSWATYVDWAAKTGTSQASSSCTTHAAHQKAVPICGIQVIFLARTKRSRFEHRAVQSCT